MVGYDYGTITHPTVNGLVHGAITWDKYSDACEATKARPLITGKDLGQRLQLATLHSTGDICQRA